MEESDPKTSIDLTGLPARFRRLRPVLERAVRRVLEDHDVRSYAVSISFVANREITKLNRERLGRSGPTDVIAFDLSEPGLALDTVGDIYISKDAVLENSVRFEVKAEEEMLRLVVHGILHVLGYRDQEPAEALEMKQVQEAVVKEFQLVADSDDQ